MRQPSFDGSSFSRSPSRSVNPRRRWSAARHGSIIERFAPFHSMARRMTQAVYDPRYLEGIEHFNRCDFFEAHESWEELWQDYTGPSRKFYQGLIQVAVCLHHFGNGNTRGAKKLYVT